MRPAQLLIAFVVGIALGGFGGSFLASQRARAAVLSGPYSDNYGPARSEITEAIAKLRAGNSSVIEHLTVADAQIERAQQWTKRFLGEELDYKQ